MHTRVAELVKQGRSIRDIAAELELSYNRARDLVNSSEVKEMLLPKEVPHDRLIGLDKELLAMQPEAIATLKHHLKEKNIHAFDLWVRALTREKQAPQQQAMIIKLSSGLDESVINITPPKEEEI